jgi:GT2 family glycosyltransferase
LYTVQKNNKINLFANGISVKMKRLDEFEIPRCRLIKIDVEGMEVEVLEGARGLLHQCRPLIYTECLSIDKGARIISLLEEEGYKVFAHCVMAYNVNNFRKNTENFLGSAREVNLFFIPGEEISKCREQFKKYQELIPLNTLDDLVLVLLRKPQYKYEVLANASAACIIGNEFWINEPELIRLRSKLSGQKLALERLQAEKRELETRADQLHQELIKHEQIIAQLQAEKRELETRADQLHQELIKHEQIIAQLQAEKGGLEKRTDQLQRQLTSIYHSKSWKIITFLRIIYAKISRITAIMLKPLIKYLLPKEISITLPDGGLNDIRCFLERTQISDEGILLVGWLFHELKGISKIYLLVESRGRKERFIGQYGQERMDVYRVFPNEKAKKSGFIIRAPLKQKGKILLTLEIQFCDGSIQKIPLGKVRFHSYHLPTSLLRLMRRINMRNIRKVLYHIRNGNWRYLINLLKMELSSARQKQKTTSLSEVLSMIAEKPCPVKSLGTEIDIIIPVYNGLEHLKKLLQSLLKNTSEPYRLILIDDCSSDPRVWPYLKEVAKRRRNTVLLRNDVNKGLPATINLGIQHTRNHFVILNTDVELPPGWLERLMYPILHFKNVASTTPFTNSGTICSFPKFLADNKLIDELSVEEIDAFFARVKVDIENVVDLPSGVGFCMGMNKDVVNEIGGFDAETFGRGYGEENDWCMRARYKGYKHLLVPNLFVYHKHGATFDSKERRKLMERNLNLLAKKHPEYFSLVEKFITEDPVGPIRDLLFLLIACRQNAVLIFDHELGGGANLYRNQLIEKVLKQESAILLYTEHPWELKPRLRCYYNDHSVEFNVSSLEELRDLVKRIAVTKIFYNNMVSYTSPLQVLDLIRELRQLKKARLIMAIHDYYPVCPSYNLINNKGIFCGIPQNIRQCEECLTHNKYVEMLPTKDIKAWRIAWERCLTEADVILCFSQSSKKLLKHAYPKLDDSKFRVRPHQVQGIIDRRPNLDFNSGLRIGVVGSINYAKGAKIIEDIAKLIEKRELNAKIYVIGEYNGNIRKKIIHVTGPYRREELPDIIEQTGANVFFVPSIWPETFSYVTEELMMMNVPLAVFNIGAPPERVSQYPLGRIIPEINPEVALNTLIELYQEMRRLTIY